MLYIIFIQSLNTNFWMECRAQSGNSQVSITTKEDPWLSSLHSLKETNQQQSSMTEENTIPIKNQLSIIQKERFWTQERDESGH